MTIFYSFVKIANFRAFLLSFKRFASYIFNQIKCSSQTVMHDANLPQHLAQDQFCTTRGVWVGPGGSVVVTRTLVRPNLDSAEFCASVVSNYSCCNVRIELTVGSLLYPART